MYRICTNLEKLRYVRFAEIQRFVKLQQTLKIIDLACLQ